MGTQVEYTNLLKTRNAKNRLAGSPFVLLSQSALSNETTTRLTVLGGNPALWDYPAGSSLASALTGNTGSTVITLPWDYVRNPLLIRMTTTVGATPTATFAIQGSLDGVGNWFALAFADSATPSVFSSATFVVTTATSLQKLVQTGQQARYVRFNITGNTNVTVSTADLSIL